VIKRQIVNGEVGPAFITAEWLTIPEEKATPLAAKRKGVGKRARSGTAEPAAKKRTKQRQQGSDGEDGQEPEADDVTGWDEGTEPGGMVMDYTTGEEVMRRE
jgi:centromere protein C